MAKAIFHSLRGDKSILIMVKPNALMFSSSPVYVPRAAFLGIMGKKESEIVPEDKGREFDIPDGYTLVDMVDGETGEIRTTESGEHLKTLHYNS